MIALLSPRLWLALALAAALAFSHFYAYRGGKNVVRTEWNLARAEADRESRKLEQLRQTNLDAAVAAGAKRQGAIAADAAAVRAQRDGLRDDLGAVRLHAAQSLAAATLTVAAYEDVFGQCVRAYSDLAEAADRHANDSLTLQQSWPK